MTKIANQAITKISTVMISAGEASGDLHGAGLVKELRKMQPGIVVRGMGSSQLREAGCDIVVDCADIAVMGIWEVLISYRKIKRALNRMIAALRESPPDLLILVDYQEFNWRLAEKAKSLGIRVLFYIGPQIWAWRPGRISSMGKKIDHMAVLFPFEEKFYRSAAIPCTFVGHPLVDEAKPTKTRAHCMQSHGLSANKKIIGLLPGSRNSEITRILPTLLKSAALLNKQRGDVEFILPIAPTIGDDAIDSRLKKFPSLTIHTVRDQSCNVIQVCDAIITASGTATLEIALMGIPNVVVYRVAPLSYWILKRIVTIDHVGLVNIVAERPVVKEYIQGNARPEIIVGEVQRLLNDTQYRTEMIDNLHSVKAKMGAGGGSRKVAELALTLLNLRTVAR